MNASSKVRSTVLIIWILCLSADAGTFAHPRALVDEPGMAAVREKLKQEPYASWFSTFAAGIRARVEADSGHRPDDWAYLASNTAFLYAVTGDARWAEASWRQVERVMEDRSYTLDPQSFGLTRAALLQGLALAYDFAYGGWSEAQRDQANRALLQLMQSVHESMGPSANYATASNWMGVRWGAVFLASRTVDPLPDYSGRKPLAKSYEWDSRERLITHLQENFYRNGWNAESLGYLTYNYSFVGPALLSLAHATGMEPGEILEFAAPHLRNSLHAVVTASLPDPSGGARALKPDLSDDHLGLYPAMILATGFRTHPEEQHPYLRWAHDLFMSTYNDAHSRHWDLFTFLFHDQGVNASNPAEAEWLNYWDPDQGIALFRNRFQGENDVLLAYSATATRVRGHRGPDTNTFRLIGLGVPWIIGGGRTGLTAGQSNLFPAHDETLRHGDLSMLGTLEAHHFRRDGSGGGWAQGTGSCLGVLQHQRFVAVDYRDATGVVGAMVISDQSENGRRLRINTPEFNDLETTTDGYLLKAPNGATLRVRVAPWFQDDLSLSSELVRYGGDTERHNYGILYMGQRYDYSRAIDLDCAGYITILVTLQAAGLAHPDPEWDVPKGRVRVGDLWLPLSRAAAEE